MTIQKNFCDLPRFLKVNRGLSCRSTCHYCKKKWKDTNTQHVSRMVMLENKVETVFYICDGCTEEIQANGIQAISSDCK